MTATRFFEGIVLLLIAFGPLAFGCDALRRAFLPGWRHAEAALADVVLLLSATVVVTEALGTVGQLSPLPVALGLALAGGAAWLLARWRRPPGARSPRVTTGDDVGRISALPTWIVAVSGVGIAAVVGSWLARVVESIRIGMVQPDTLWYHLPIAVRWVQTGRTTGIQFFDTDPVTAYYPASSSLFHAVGFLFFRTDLVSTVIDLGWMALALLAAWCAGRAFGVGPVTAMAVALLLGTAGLVVTQPGGAYDDVVGIALLLAAVGLALHRRSEVRRMSHLALIGLALGLCVGAKYTFVAPAVMLAIGMVVITDRGRRLRATVVLFVAACITGSYWYVRNAIVVGNPLPSLSLHLGPLSLPSAKGAQPTSVVARFLFDSAAWRQQLLPGLRLSLGPAWPALLALAFVGMIAAIAQRNEPIVRMLGIVAVLSFVAFLFTPQYLLALGRPVFFAVNVRYAAPSLTLGLLLLPIALRRWLTWVTVIVGATLVVTQLDPASWPTHLGWTTFADHVGAANATGGDAAWAIALLALAAAAGALVVWIWNRSRSAPRATRRGVRWATLVAAPLVVLLLLAGVRRSYLDHRYVGLAPYPQLTAWVRGVHRQRIAVAGAFMQDQYPLTGADLSNWVQVAGIKTSGGGVREPTTCADWVHMLDQGHYRYAVIFPALHLAQWTAAQAGSRKVLQSRLSGTDLDYFVYRLRTSDHTPNC
jgi:hypothetical protein